MPHQKTKPPQVDPYSEQSPWYSDNDAIKHKHRDNVKSYRKSVKSKLDKFLKKLNEKIKSGKVISWNDMKKLKKFKKKETHLDDDLIPTFQEFYSKLYADHHPTMDSLTKEALIEATDSLVDNSSETPNELLNSPFTPEELSTAISGLKNGKDVVEEQSSLFFDHISNEMIKALPPKRRVST